MGGFWDFLPGIGDKPKAKPAPKPSETRPSTPKPSSKPYTKDDLMVRNWLGTPTRDPGTGYKPTAESLLPKASKNDRPVSSAQQPRSFNMPSQVGSALTQQGWAVPTAESPDPSLAMLEGELDTANARELAQFSYNMDKGEAARIADTFGWQNPGKPLDAEKLRIESKGARGVPLTWEAYDKLTPEQRKAVDFNTQLVNAREEDLKPGPYKPPDEAERADYNRRAEAVFGKGGGSQTYAPNTLKLLEDIDFKAVGQDLDEFLALEHTVTTDQLKGWTGVGGAAQRKDAAGFLDANEYGTIRSAENRTKVTADAIAKAGAQIEEALYAANSYTPDTPSYFAELANPGSQFKPGWGGDGIDVPAGLKDQDDFYRTMRDVLLDPSTQNLDVLWEGVAASKMSESEIDDMFRYLDDWSKWASKSSIDLRGRKSVSEFRSLAGLEEIS